MPHNPTKIITQLIGAQVNITTLDGNTINGEVWCVHEPTETIIVRHQSTDHSNKAECHLVKYCFIKTMEKLTEGTGIKKSTLPRLNYENIMRRENNAIALRKMTIFLQHNNIDMRALEILKSLCVSLPCEFTDGSINVYDKIFIDSPYTVDKIRGEIDQYPHIKVIVENVWSKQ